MRSWTRLIKRRGRLEKAEQGARCWKLFNYSSIYTGVWPASSGNF